MTEDDNEMGTTEQSTLEEEAIDLAHYRRVVKQFMDMRRYGSALFWAEKVCILSQNDAKDVYALAHCMFLLKEYHRAAHTIRMHELEKTNIACYNLLLESLYMAEEYSQAVLVINNIDIELLALSLINQPLDGGGVSYSQSVYSLEDPVKNEMLASINYLKGKIFEAMDNRGMAMDYYVQALHKSIYCYEALEALVEHEMLLAWEEKELIQNLPLAHQSSESDAKFIRQLYEAKLKKYYKSLGPSNSTEELPIGNLIKLKSIKELTERIEQSRRSDANLHKSARIVQPRELNFMSPANKILEDLKLSISHSPFSFNVSLMRASQMNDSNRSHMETPVKKCSNRDPADSQQCLALSTCLERVQHSTDLMAAEAERLFYDNEYKKCFKILNELLKVDPYHKLGLTVQIGCLVEFGDYNKLFYVAHKLVDQYPDNAISWYAVGCYYDMIGKSDPARRYLAKATTLDRLYGPAWLAYGHSFAKENEHDQAMAAYFKATQLMRGCHLPLLYIGVECGLTKNLELAEKFFYQAMTIAPLDVFVLHELGVIKYEYEYYESAEEVFRATMEIVTSRAKKNNEELSPRWEPLFNNLGHCCRKTKKYTEALEFHQYALLLRPQSSQTLTCIGFIYSLMGDLEEAITYFHKSLAINRDCIVTSTILKHCIEDLMSEDNLISEIFKGASNENLGTLTTESMASTSHSTALSSKSALTNAQRLPTIEESPRPYKCLKLKFPDDDMSMSMSLTNSEQMDSSNVAMMTGDD